MQRQVNCLLPCLTHSNRAMMRGCYSGYLVRPDIVPGWWEFGELLLGERLGPSRGKPWTFGGRIKVMSQAREGELDEEKVQNGKRNLSSFIS